MDPETAAFLRKVGYTVLAAFLWMGINATAALFKDSAFIGEKISMANVLFYIWLIISFFILFIILKKLWKPE